MEGFIHLKVSPWLRRLITRSIAIIPTIIVVAFTGERGTEKLLLLSQVILSLQLSFAVVPLVIFTSSRRRMGEFVNGLWLKVLSWSVAVLIAGLNAWFLVMMLR
jgi:manganese transport protein